MSEIPTYHRKSEDIRKIKYKMNRYNPKIHHRRSIRLKNYDYTKEGLYFITMFCKNGTHRFGKIVNDKMKLNECGMIAEYEWFDLINRNENIKLHEFVVMPNHVHGIIEMKNPNFAPVGATFTVAHGDSNYANDAGNLDEIEDANNAVDRARVNHARTAAENRKKSMGDIVGGYKSVVSNRCQVIYERENQIMGKLWHRNFYEIIIRDEKAYYNISEYIINNPINWNEDKFYKE